MSQKTNLNISPYFDDFNFSEKDYHKVLFKPGYPIQARELTTLQSILQSQIEKFGTHIFKDGSSVIGGQLSYNNSLDYVILENEYFGVDVENYLPYLNSSIIVGRTSGVRAQVVLSITKNQSYLGNSTLYVRYISPGNDANESEKFLDGEVLQVESDISSENSDLTTSQTQVFLQAGEAFCTTRLTNSTGLASSATIESGIFFIRGYFVSVGYSRILLDPYGTFGNFKVGLRILENIATSYDDPTLNDNSNGFSNYAAPGADRFQIYARLDKKDLNDFDTNDFVTITEIRDGTEISSLNLPRYDELSEEFARRTFEESGNYYTKSPNISIRETLNNLKGNNGIFYSANSTYNGNIPSENLGTYVISPLKAYIMGYEVSTISPTYLDFQKPRTTKTLSNQSINYYTGPTYTLNRVYGSPKVGFSNYYVSLHLDRVGSDQTAIPGKEIGLARVYDFALESGSYNTSNSDLNEWDISLYDIDTYTEISLNEPISLQVPTQIKGNSSGAIGYLRYDASNSGIITAYSIEGKFYIGETFSFDGIPDSRISTGLNAYNPSDAKSLYGVVGSAYTFTGDIKQTSLIDVGFVSIGASSAGVSTITSSDFIFTNSIKPNTIVSYTNPGNSVPTFSKVTEVYQNSLVIQPITSVTGICDGSLPTSNISPSDLKILYSPYQSSSDNTLYTSLPKLNIQSVGLENSNITIRKQIDVVVNSGSFTISSSENEVFLPFDEERYCLINENGTAENLTTDKFTLSTDSTTLTIDGLSNNGNAKLIATLRKSKLSSKIKNRNKVNSITINKSKYSSSGIGSTTLNDGLEFGNYPYGTRVHDSDICLSVCDVNKVLAIYESTGILDPEIPSIIFSSLNGVTGDTSDLLIGEEFIGSSSNSIGILVEKNNSLKISHVKLSSNSFIAGEEVTFVESGVKAIVSSINFGDNNITNNFTFDRRGKDTILDYSKITRKKSAKEPKRKLKIIFESSTLSESDSGDLVSANSYNQFDYCDIPKINGIRYTDIIDIRPRVSQYVTTQGQFSPFEFLGRNITDIKNSSKYIFASDESFSINYTYYLPRIDKIFLSKDGAFQLVRGEASDTPQAPKQLDNSIELAQVYLPAYLCNIKDAEIILRDYKRYRMSDIKKLEDRIKNLEYYTSLSVLESDTASLQIVDANGINRFKSGFFVDDFSTTKTQKTLISSKNSLDILNSELRPPHYTTQIDLLLGSSSLSGIGTSPSQTVDARFASDLIGSNIKRTGQIITLDYQEIPEIIQPYSSRVANVSSYSSAFFGGTIELFPSSDTWIDQIRMESKSIEVEGDFMRTESELKEEGYDQQTGFSPTVWNSWENMWTGESIDKFTERNTSGWTTIVNEYERTIKTGTATRTGTKKVLKEQFDNTSFGDQVLDSKIVPYMRSRNIEFIGRKFKPYARLYGFFDGVNISNYVIPKLIKISMVDGTFEVGETVIGYNQKREDYLKQFYPATRFFDSLKQAYPRFASNNLRANSSELDNTQISCSFRVSTPNHKFGEYNNSTEIYYINPYDRINTIPNSYSSTSTIINVDTYSLANKVQGTYFGAPSVGMVLRGQTSGASAVVESLDLVSDQFGDIVGFIWIPDPNIDINPKFESGTKVFRLTSDSSNSSIEGVATTAAEERYYSEGKINTVQENIIVTRNARFDIENVSETKEVQEIGPNVLINTTTINNTPAYTPAPSYSAPSYSAPSFTPASTPAYVAPAPAPAPAPAQTSTPSFNFSSINNQGSAVGNAAAGRMNQLLAAAGLPQTAVKGMDNSALRDLYRDVKAANPALVRGIDYRGR